VRSSKEGSISSEIYYIKQCLEDCLWTHPGTLNLVEQTIFDSLQAWISQQELAHDIAVARMWSIDIFEQRMKILKRSDKLENTKRREMMQSYIDSIPRPDEDPRKSQSQSWQRILLPIIGRQ
jgi:hypothetical protein